MSFSLSGPEAMSVLDRLPQAVLVADNSRAYVYANQAACILLNLSKADVIGRHIEDFVTPEVREHVPAQWHLFLQTGVQAGEYQLLRPDGVLRDVEFTAVARIQPDRHISFIRDKTEEKRLRAAQVESENIAQLALQAQRMGYWLWKSKTADFTSNAMLAKIFGLPALENKKYGWEAFMGAIHPEDQAYVTHKLGSIALYGNDYELEYRIVQPNGQVRWVSDHGHALFGTDGSREGLLGVCWDTTEHRQWEASLRLSENRFRSLVEQSPFSTQVFRPDGKSVMVNRAWSQFWGSISDNNEDYNILRDPQLVAAGVMPLVQRAFEGHAAELPVVGYKPARGSYAGTTIWIRTFIYPVCDDDGQVREVVGVNQDVSGSKQLEIERAKQAEELARSNAELQRFVYVASHDLKEPLRNMVAFSQLLALRCKAQLSDEDFDYLNHISGGARRMSALIDGLLDYSRTSFARDLVLVISDVNELLDQAIENLRVAISQTRAVITSDALPKVRCAPLNVVQLFQNLIGNAIKYAGGVEPRIHVSASENGDSWRFQVVDNGIGIEPAYHDQIFGVFTRLHGHEYAGTGIGLAICKAIVEKHGGKIWLESDKGVGAKFFFTLPK